ncbi:MAG: hypothetical protein DWQ29_16525 [Planctomycetota bacterium]|nr:MAG: hypothetical protein DWQ29_16525 [Planctomycetota bacterium]
MIVAHLSAVVLTICFARADRGLLINDAVSDWLVTYGQILFAPALIAFFLCPFYFLVALIVSSVRRGPAVRAFIAEALITLAHVYAFLPMVQ